MGTKQCKHHNILMSEDTKAGNQKSSKKDGQCNGPQHTTQKTRDRATLSHYTPGMNSCTPKR
jgi:hypothetical protein